MNEGRECTQDVGSMALGPPALQGSSAYLPFVAAALEADAAALAFWKMGQRRVSRPNRHPFSPRAHCAGTDSRNPCEPIFGT
jgi:hypothetical protein